MSGFPFIYVCNLLDDLERLIDPRNRLVVPREAARLTTERFIAWSKAHCARLNACYWEDDAVGRTLRPESNTDRANGLDEDKLEHVIARVLMLPAAQVVDLRKWRDVPAFGDLGACVARVLETISLANPVRGLTNLVAVQDIDQGLLKISAFNLNSSQAVRSLAQHIPHLDQLGIIENLYLRMQSREAKWLTRLILKSYAPIKIPESPEVAASHSGLPNMLCLRAEVRHPKPVPMLRHAYSGWIRGADSAEISSTRLSTPPTTPPEQSAVSTNPPKNDEQSETRAENPSSSPTSASLAFSPKATAKPSTNLTSRTKSPELAPFMQVKPVGTPRQHSLRKRSLGGLPPPPTTPRFDSSSTAASSNAPEHPSSIPPLVSLIVQTRSRKCSLAAETQTCPFSNCNVVLAPHLFTNTRLIQHLLPLHGCRYTTSPLSLADLCSTSSPLPSDPTQEKRKRKIALLDSHRTEEAVEFMKVIRALDLRKAGGDAKGGGKKDWVEVYDWRLLAMVTRVEKGERWGREAGAPWRRCWIGAV